MNTNKSGRRLNSLIIALLTVLACYQTYLTTNDYIRSWRMPIWRLRQESSFRRSAVFNLSTEGAAYLDFLNGVLPPAVKVVPPEHSGPFSEQSILQFFMLDKSIMVCPTGADGILCLSKPDKYIIATTAYPPHESDIDKIFIEYPDADPNYPYKGIYVPRDYREGNYSAVYPINYNIPLTLLRDAGVLLAWFLLGWLITSAIIHNPFHPISLIMGFPLGMGVYTWTIFVISVFGAPLTSWSILITYTGLLLSSILVVWLRRVKFQIPAGAVTKSLSSAHLSPITLSIICLSTFLLLALLYIGVGRGYSTFDDMAIWSLKGYYMAYKQDLFAAATASGHGLSYPLNLSLAISTFYLIDQDLLPGSKVAYFLVFLSTLTCIYWFLRKNNTSKLIASLGILLIISTPIIFKYASYGFANIPFTCYLVIGLLISMMGVINNKPLHLYSGGLVLSLAGWTRPEGIGFAFVLACVVAACAISGHFKVQQLLNYFLITLSLCGSWIILGYPYFSSDEIGASVNGLLHAFSSGTFSWDSIWVTLRYSWDHFTGVPDWGLVIPAALLIILIKSPKMIHHRNPAAIPILTSSLLTYLLSVGLFVTKFHQNPDNYQTYLGFLYVSFDRAQFPAITFLIIALVLILGYSFRSVSKKTTVAVDQQSSFIPGPSHLNSAK